MPGRVVSSDGEIELSVSEALGAQVLEETIEFHHAPTTELDDDGHGDPLRVLRRRPHRAVVDVDIDLGLVRVVEITTSQMSAECSTRFSSLARSKVASPKGSDWR